MHAISFVHFNIMHMTNWILNGLPERFPKLKVIWIESGLAWVPFLMQRLDSEYMMRQLGSAAPEAPAERLHARHVLHQPAAGDASNLELTEATFKAIKAETPAAVRVRLAALGFRPAEFDHDPAVPREKQAKRNILGLNAARLFNLKVPKHKLIKREDQEGAGGRVPVTA